MTLPAYKQVLLEALRERRHTAASDSTVRLALSMLVNDPQAAVSPEVREAIAKRLDVPPGGQWQALTGEEKAQWREGLLRYLQARNANLVPIVAPHLEA